MRPIAAFTRRHVRTGSLGRAAFVAVVLCAAAPGRAQFPIVESFRNANAGSWFLPPSSIATFTSGNVDPVGQGWLRASHRKLDAKRSLPYRPYHTHDEKQPLTPGKVYELNVEI